MSKEKSKGGPALKCVKLANAVKIGTTEELFIDGKRFELSLHDNIYVRIFDPKTSDETFTTVFNVIYLKQ
jgi:hypothetical protein